MRVPFPRAANAKRRGGPVEAQQKAVLRDLADRARGEDGLHASAPAREFPSRREGEVFRTVRLEFHGVVDTCAERTRLNRRTRQTVGPRDARVAVRARVRPDEEVEMVGHAGGPRVQGQRHPKGGARRTVRTPCRKRGLRRGLRCAAVGRVRSIGLFTRVHRASLPDFPRACAARPRQPRTRIIRPMTPLKSRLGAGFSIAALCSLLALSACSSGRPMVAARAEADHAFRYAQWDKAAPAYLEILEKAPGDWEVEYRYGVCLAKLGNLRDARTHVETAHASNPTSEEVAAGLAEVYFELGEKQKLVQLLQDRGNLQRSIPSLLLLADYGLRMDDPDTANTAVRGAILLSDGASVEPYLKAVEVAERLGDTKTAGRRLRQAYTVDPESPAVAAKLAEYGLAAEGTTGLPPGP